MGMGLYIGLVCRVGWLSLYMVFMAVYSWRAVNEAAVQNYCTRYGLFKALGYQTCSEAGVSQGLS
jgi:hypothetical protein